MLKLATSSLKSPTNWVPSSPSARGMARASSALPMRQGTAPSESSPTKFTSHVTRRRSGSYSWHNSPGRRCKSGSTETACRLWRKTRYPTSISFVRSSSQRATPRHCHRTRWNHRRAVLHCRVVDLRAIGKASHEYLQCVYRPRGSLRRWW